MKKAILIVSLIVLPMIGFSVEGYVSFSLSDRYYDKFINDNSISRIKFECLLSEKIFGLDLDLKLINYYIPGINLGKFIVSDRVGIDVSGYYETDIFSFEFGNQIWSGAEDFDEIRFIASYFHSFEVIVISPRLGLFYDLKGIYTSLSLVPSLSIPVNPIVSISVPITIGAMSEGYRGYSISGMSGILFSPKLSLYWEKVDISAEGGYFISLNENIQSYPYISLKLGIEF